jgi:hypothetical protein
LGRLLSLPEDEDATVVIRIITIESPVQKA